MYKYILCNVNSSSLTLPYHLSQNQLRVVFKVRPFISLDKLQVLHIIFGIIMMFILWLTAVKVMELNKCQI